MRIRFSGTACPGHLAAQAHIRRVYRSVYDADVGAFAPLLVTATRPDGEILCAAGIRAAAGGFFSDCYLDGDFTSVLRLKAGLQVAPSEIMEVVSLAATSPFPVLPMLDAMIRWGRENGMTCGVFTATGALRKLLRRTGLSFVELVPAQAGKVAAPAAWGRYYDADPWVCAFSEIPAQPVILSPRARAAQLQTEAQR